MNGVSIKPRRRYNLSSLFYTEELGARVVAQSGIPTDRHHLGKLIFQSLKEAPDFVLQIDGALDQSETSGSVLARSIRCALAMKNLGLKKGDAISVLAPNHNDLIIPIHAAMFLGICVAGTEVTLGVRELEESFKDNQPRLVFCQSDKALTVEEALKRANVGGLIVTFNKGSKFQNLTDFLEENSNNSNLEDFKPADFDPKDTPILLCATSGTTGVPKSAILTHTNLVIAFTQLMSRENVFPTPTRLYLMVSPVQWISATMIYITSALYKFTRLQTSAPMTRDHIYDLINKYKPSKFLASPTLMVNLLAEGERDRCDFTSFETFLIGGSFVPQVIIDILKKIAPQAQPELAYGMTELAGIALAFDSESPAGCVGKESPHLQYRLVNPTTLQDITEPHVTGELWYKGPAVFKGYLNNPEATKEGFVDGWFRSGDLLRRDENYNYFYVDRLKTLLKYRNNQISPIELENVIRKHPGVHDVVVVGIPDLECGDLPTAVVVRAAGHSVTAQEIKDIVKENLTDSKQLRGGVIFLNDLPLTVTNKVDRVKAKKMAQEIARE